MDPAVNDHYDRDYPADEAATLAPSKSSSILSNEVEGDNEVVQEFNLELESAQLEIEVAEAMKRAAEAKRRAAEILRRKSSGVIQLESGLKLDANLSTKLRVINADVRSAPSRANKLNAPAERVPTVASESGELAQLLARMELPKCDFPKFDGSPLQYVAFFRYFEEHVESRVQDDGLRLNYLFHYCEGKAKVAIQGCLLYPAIEGYKKAREVLKDLFGQRHYIVRSMIDEVTKPGSVANDSESLSSYATKLVCCADALERLGYLSDLNSVHTIEKVLSKLPRFMIVDWVKHAETIYRIDREPEFRDLCEFVSAKASLQRNRYSHLLSDRRETTLRERPKPSRTFAVSAAVSSCAKCQGGHSLENCPEFLSLDVKARWDLVSQGRLCFRCLCLGHRADRCLSRKLCEVENCRKMHHNLLHNFDRSVKVTSASCQNVATGLGVSMGVVPLIAEGPKGIVLINALLDTGADTSLVQEELVSRLGLVGDTSMIRLNTPLGDSVQKCSRVSFRVRSLDGQQTIDIERAYTINSVIDIEAVRPSDQTLATWSHLEGIQFTPLPSKTVNLLIGLDTPEAHWILDQRRGRKGDPYADLTPFGWVLRGPLDKGQRNYGRAFSVRVSLEEIDKNLRKLYDHDFADNSACETAFSPDDERTLDMSERSLEMKDGHISVGLPWRDDTLKLVCNKTAASKRLTQLGKRFNANAELRESYTGVIERYLSKGYAIRQETVDDADCFRWYLPHHAVINPRKPNKVRVVFDCAAVCCGTSLNRHLLQGPNIVSNLVGVLLRFRQKPIALTADIEDMFLQVRVPEKDQLALRFLWWEGGVVSAPPNEYRLQVHPFGAVSSPFCASFALKKTAIMFGDRFPPVVSKTVMNSFYVDDCLVSVDEVPAAISLAKGLSELLSLSGFRLTKWSSNSREVLEQIPVEERNNDVKCLEMTQLPKQRTLGLVWDMEKDSFGYEVALREIPLTRRVMLSEIAAIYDPLGWIGPYMLPLKQLFQSLCKEGIGWDERLSPQVEHQWRACKQILLAVLEFKVPRWYLSGISGSPQKLELHLFCDASEKGYGAVAYLRLRSDTESSRCVLVMAKSRVNPLKSITIPRLELTAAALATELSCLLRRELENVDEVTFWTDSAVVLYYINNQNRRYATFVANRVSKIRDVSVPSQWRHVDGENNPADLASRGMELTNDKSEIWLNGPKFLRKPGAIDFQSDWTSRLSLNLLEMKTDRTACAVSRVRVTDYLQRFSSWTRLLKCVAWLLRYKTYLQLMANGRCGMNLRLGNIKIDELRSSSIEVLKTIQRDSFPDELRALTEGSILPNNSRLRKLSPVLLEGLICVGGRLQWSCLSEISKHPIILPTKHHVIDLIIRHYHEIEGHVGRMQVLAAIRRKFWILQGGSAVRRVVGACMRCRKQLARPSQQQMSPLPSLRSGEPAFAFSHVGVDYFGPMYVKRGRVEEKRYGCLFTCLHMRAVHIEVTHCLSTDSFIQALVRFMARRGQPRTIVSDNGSNLKGAHIELRQCLQSFSQKRINDFLSQRDIEWQFIPPDASHWGGVWERMVRSVKRVLMTISHGQRMTDESLLTFLTEAERIVNNRPLVALSEDHKDLETLTPNQLLLLRANQTVLDEMTFSSSCLRWWRRLNVLVDTFWKRWKIEYLATLTARHKWLLKGRNFKVGDLVLVTSEFIGRNHWPLGLIQEVFPGVDGLVREVLVRTARGVLKRDARKLCLLEGADD